MTPSPGFSIEMLTLPHEDPLEHERLVEEWTSAYPNCSPIERGYLDQAINALMERRRIGRIRATLRAQKVRTAVLEWEHAQEDTVAYWLNQFNVHAPSALVGLLRSASGCRWALDYWCTLDQELRDHGTFYGEARVAAIQLQGQSANIGELFYSDEAYTTWRDSIACQANPKQKDIDIALDRRTIPKALLEREVRVWPCDPAECRARLQALVDRELARLRVLEETLRTQYEEPAKAEAREMALASLSAEEMRLLRAEQMHEQSYQRATTALLKARKQSAAARAVAARERDESLFLAPARGPRGKKPNEPEESQDPVKTGVRNDDLARTGVAQPVVARSCDRVPEAPRLSNDPRQREDPEAIGRVGVSLPASENRGTIKPTLPDETP